MPMTVTYQLLAFFGSALFFLMLFVPTVYQPVKAALLAVLPGGIVWGALHGTIIVRLHKSVVTWVAVLSLTGPAFIGLGAINDAPGAWRVGTVYVLWPLVFAVLIAALSPAGLRALLGTLAVAAIALGLYGVKYVAYAKGWWPDALYWALDQGQAIGFYDGFVEYNMYSVSTLLVIVPLLAVALMEWRGGRQPVPRVWLWLGYALCLGLAILSGRRALSA